jgi:hypothetical protein
MVQALYMEWELPTPQGDGPTLDLAAGLGGGRTGWRGRAASTQAFGCRTERVWP